MHKIREEFDTNRSMRLKPRKSRGWCYSCDCSKVSDGQRCPFCGV